MSEKVEQIVFSIPATAKLLQKLGIDNATPRSVSALIASGDLPHLKFGKRFFVSRTALLKWLERAERNGAS